jgi:hypothetical protein
MTLLAAIQAQNVGLQRSALGGCGLSAALRKSLESLAKDRKENDSRLQKDTVSLAKPLITLSKSGLDLEKSRFVQTSQLLSFDLTYQETSVQQLSLQGCYDFHSESLTADFSFVSALSIKDSATGEERQELFRFNFHLEAQHSISRSGSSSIQKEDILQFARKLVEKIAKLHSEGKEIDGLALDSEDLKELGAVNHGHLLKSIMAIIQVLKSVSFLQKREGEHVWVDLDRQKGLVTTQEKQEQESLSFSLTVERVVQESSAESIPVENVQSK